MLLEIPVVNDVKNYKMTVTLNERDYVLIFEYNQRDSYWYMGIEGYAEGQRLVHGPYIFRNFKYIENFPQGDFFVYDTTGNRSNPSDTNFGDTVKLLYNEAEWVNYLTDILRYRLII